MANVVVFQRFWMRRDTEANWAAANPVLAAGEFGVVIDGATGQPLAEKMGDGSTAWLSLPYSSPAIFGAAGSGTNTITATFDPTPVLYDGMIVRVRAAGANTGAATFNPNSLGAADIKKEGGGALAAGDIVGAGHELLLVYRSSVPRWELLNPRGGAAGGGGFIVDRVRTEVVGDAAVTSASIPYDNTTPQSSEGVEFTGFSTTHTAANSANIIRVRLVIPMFISSSSGTTIFALFRDSTLIAASLGTPGAAGTNQPMILERAFVAGDVSSHTYTVRAGGNVSATIRINSDGSVHLNNSIVSLLEITEETP